MKLLRDLWRGFKIVLGVSGGRGMHPGVLVASAQGKVPLMCAMLRRARDVAQEEKLYAH